MKTTIGKEGLDKSWQKPFPETTECCRCGNISRIGFVAHEGLVDNDKLPLKETVSNIHKNKPEEGSYWLHDYCAVAVYFCKSCLETTSLYNQG